MDSSSSAMIGGAMKHLAFAALLLLPSAAQAQIMFGHGTAIDGDTLELGGERIRLHGIDALEASQACTRGGESWQCGQEAKTVLSGLLARGSVQCNQRDRDVYGRIVATCTAGGIDLARAMVEAGLAVAPSQFGSPYAEIEKRVRELGFGMWGSKFEIPADYRAANPHLVPPVPKPKALPPPGPVFTPYVTQSPSQSTGNVYFRNCDAARAAGAAPIQRGQPGYRPQLDADGDGVACEPYRGR